jgi:hypothetical protein
MLSVVVTRVLVGFLILASACGYRRSPIGGRCLKEDKPFSEIYDPMTGARSLIDSTQFQREMLGSGLRVDDVQFERDERVCRAISVSLGRLPRASAGDATPRADYADVVVIRLGDRGYYVQTQWHTSEAGEFHCYAMFVDRRFKRRTWFCG